MTDDVGVGLLATTFPDVMVRAAIEATGKREQRNRALPARLMVYLTMALWLNFGMGYVRVLRSLLSGLRWARGGWEGYTVPSDGAISRARDRLGSAPMRALFEATAKPTVADGHDGVFWRGLRKVAVDGTVFDVPACEDNRAAFDTPSGGVLPQVCLVALAECGSMALIGAAFDSIEVGERALLERLLDKLTSDMLVLADRGFPSYTLFTAAARTGAHLLWRVSDSFTLPVKQRLEDGTYLSELKGKRRGERVSVRVIEYSVADDDGVSEVFALITTLLDPEQAPAIELAQIYADRWHVEILFRLVKVDLRTSGGVLRSRSAEGVRQELWALLCVYQALRSLVTRAAVIAGVDPTRISFPPVLDAVKDSVRTAFSP
ncbi:IS4 family transposase [Streptomyces sp. H27-D2]|uniref:IS4 family transposase n=1 Tax=Streptomyces sp. H27-D2 TaxID=3046304 RepID=UPI002DBA289A|nr:IS4 family transposase [Streptomyces sp. H27-D2]